MTVRAIAVVSQSDGPAAVPTQFLRSSAGIPGAEHRLLLAVLTDAVECFQNLVASEVRREHRLLAETEAWLFGVSEKAGRPCREGDGFSFEEICDALGLCPDYVREGLLRWNTQLQTVRKRA